MANARQQKLPKALIRRTLESARREIEQIERMEMRDWHIKKLWNYYIRKANVENVLPQSWADQLLPTTGGTNATSASLRGLRKSKSHPSCACSTWSK